MPNDSEDKPQTKNVLIRDVPLWIIEALDDEVKELRETAAIYRGVSRVDLARKILEDHAKRRKSSKKGDDK